MSILQKESWSELFLFIVRVFPKKMASSTTLPRTDATYIRTRPIRHTTTTLCTLRIRPQCNIVLIWPKPDVRHSLPSVPTHHPTTKPIRSVSSQSATANGARKSDPRPHRHEVRPSRARPSRVCRCWARGIFAALAQLRRRGLCSALLGHRICSIAI